MIKTSEQLAIKQFTGFHPIQLYGIPSQVSTAMALAFAKSYTYLDMAKFLFLFTSLSLNTNSISFEFTSFNPNNHSVTFQGDASVANSRIQLTRNQIGDTVKESYGRALYQNAIKLWEAKPKWVTDFTTNFTFNISKATSTNYGDRLTFVLVPNNTQIPNDSSGGCLALFSNNQNHTACVLNQTIVAVEFDTFKNPTDPSSNHIGIDVNSIVSVSYVNVSVSLLNRTAQAFISYNSTTKNLSVLLCINETSSFSLSHTIDLSTVLPERVQVGFSASTGNSVEIHQISAWSFSSTVEETVASPTMQPSGRQSKSKRRLVVGIGGSVFMVLIFGISIAWIRLQRNSPREGIEFEIDEDFDKDAGPKRFSYPELSRATNNFAIQGKLGEGGFGGVYKGVLTGPERKEIAVKKIKSGSNQGKKEYISEVKIISKLRHRNLVQLLGWCHDHGELLLVYEFMPNGSLDFHLFGRKLVLLPWPTRYKIALGLASALLYLHEEWEQSVVHRDIKSSNVMLDSNFSPKLGDFGLARFANHDADLQTTALAGTPGYMAPECLFMGKASKESDVYSFGIVALELACGRKVVEVMEESSKVNLVEWVWDLYGKGMILDAMDNDLEGEFEEVQAKCLMVVGLWCSHPDVSYRPKIKQVIAALNDEIPIPNLPPQLPVPVYLSPGMNMSTFSSFASSSTIED